MERITSPSAFNQSQKASSSITFATPDQWTDVVFIVEGRKIHYNKTVLSMCSPVFEAMFEADFKEKTEKEIQLPGKKYEDMIMLFEHIHPKYAWKPIREEEWEKLLILADEYQVRHIKGKCEKELKDQIELFKLRNRAPRPFYPAGPDVGRGMTFYLLMCERYKLTKNVRTVMELVAWRTAADLDGDEHFQALSPEMQRDVFRLKCR